MTTEIECLEGIPFPFLDDMQEAGLKIVHKGARILVRDICKLHGVEIGDALIIYIKKGYLPKDAKRRKIPVGEYEKIYEAGLRVVQVEYRIALGDIFSMLKIGVGDAVVLYFKKTDLKAQTRIKGE